MKDTLTTVFLLVTLPVILVLGHLIYLLHLPYYAATHRSCFLWGEAFGWETGMVKLTFHDGEVGGADG